MSKRLFLAGTVDRFGIAHPLPECTGYCNCGRSPYNCPTGQTEMACDVAHDAYRVIRAPIRSARDEEAYQWHRRWSKLIALAAVAGLIALLRLAGAQSFGK